MLKKLHLLKTFVAAALLLLASRAHASEPGPYFTDVGQLNYAKFLLNEHNYALAAREFSRLIEKFPASPLKPEAQYRMAEAYLFAGQYRDAANEFKQFIRNFGDSPLARMAELKLSEAETKLKESLVPAPPPPPRAVEPTPGLRAVQVMFFEGRNHAEIDRELKGLKDAGVDTVIVRVFHNRGDRFYPFAAPRTTSGVYFRTSSAPMVDDILLRITEAAHKNGLKVFAWMTTRYADYGMEDSERTACLGYDINEKRYSRCKGLDLFNEDALKRLEAIYSDLADYEIDGILFQDDLVLRHNEGFGEPMAALFRKDTGLTLNPEGLYLRGEGAKVHYTQLFWEWASWKNKHLLGVAKRLRDVVKRKRPDVKFAINLMYESVTNPPYALAWLSQNLEEAVDSGFDYFSIMAYHRQMEEELNADSKSVREIISKMAREASLTVGEPQRVLMKIQTIDWRTGQALSDEEVVGLIRSIKGSAVSLAVVPYRPGFPFGVLGPRDMALAME